MAGPGSPHRGERVRRRAAEFLTLTHQCWLFVIGSACFAVATAPGFPALAGAGATNVLCFIGSWFFTTAGWTQLQLARGRVEWSSAATQFVGTILFNVSTGASVWAHAVFAERRLVWAPDAVGSTAFLISGVLGVVAVGWWSPRSAEWRAQWINLAGCVAFGISALAAFVTRTGVTVDERVANLGTFVGALCFLTAALMVLPQRRATEP